MEIIKFNLKGDWSDLDSRIIEQAVRTIKRGGSIGLYGWVHNPSTVDTDSWHRKGVKVLNVSGGITTNQRPYRSFERSEMLMSVGKICQSKLITNKYKISEIEKDNGRKLHPREQTL